MTPGSPERELFSRVVSTEQYSPEERQSDWVSRWQSILSYYHQTFGFSLLLEVSPYTRHVSVADGVVRANPDSGGCRNEEFVLLHECVHEKQRGLFGFKTTVQMIHAIVNDMTLTEVGVRDWVEDYTMPPFIVEAGEREVIFSYYSTEELRERVARGIRDIHCDVMAIRMRNGIYVSTQERMGGIDPEKKFLSQLTDELRSNVPGYDVRSVADSRPDFIRKIARFRAVSGGAARILDNGSYREIADAYDSSMQEAFAGELQQYTVYHALATAYEEYFIRCAKRTDVVDFDRLLSSLDADNPLIRARGADFMGELGDIRALPALEQKLGAEEHDTVKAMLLYATEEIAIHNWPHEDAWKGLQLVLEKGTEQQAGRVVDFLGTVPQEHINKAAQLLLHAGGVTMSSSLIALGKRAPYAIVENIRSLARREGQLPIDFQMSDVLAVMETGGAIPLGEPARVLVGVAKQTFPEAYAIAVLLTKSSEMGERIAGIQTLSRLGVADPDTTVRILEQVFESPAPVPYHVAWAVGFIGKAQARFSGNMPERVLRFLEEKSTIRDPLIGATVVQSLRGIPASDGNSMRVLDTLASILTNMSGAIDTYQGGPLPDDWGPHLLRLSCAKATAELYVQNRMTVEVAAKLLMQFSTEHIDFVYTNIAKQNPKLALDIFHWYADHPGELVQLPWMDSQGDALRLIIKHISHGVGEAGIAFSDEALDLLEHFAKHTDSFIRGDVLYAVAKIGDKNPLRVMRIIQFYARDKEPSVRRAAAVGLKFTAAALPEATFALLKALAFDEDDGVTGHVIEILGQMGDAKRAWHLLIKLMDRQISGYQKKQIIEAMGKLGAALPDEAFIYLEELLRDPQLSQHAASALTQFAAPLQLGPLLGTTSILPDAQQVIREYLMKISR